jgi:translocation and assembly module TamA
MIRAAAALLACALLAGCSSLKLFGNDKEADPAAAPVPTVRVYQVEIAAPEALRTLLQNNLELARFQNVPEADRPTSAELARLAGAAPAQARALLETEGYFNADVKVETTIGEGGLPQVRLRVEPGPRVRVDTLSLRATGALQDAAASGDGAAADQIATLQREFTLQPGEPFRQPVWSSAKNAALARLRADGYPAANWQQTAARIDATEQRASLDLVVDSGPLFRLGEIEVTGLQRYPRESVTRLAHFPSGERYSEKLLLDYQDRLQKLGLFEGASVEIDPDTDHAAAARVRVRVKELSLQQATVGVGVSANTGPRVTLEHWHRRPFGWDWVAHNKLEVGRDLQSWTGELLSHPKEGLYRNLVSGGYERLRSTGEVRTAWSARLGRTQDTPRIERLYFGEAAHVQVDNDTTGRSSTNAYSANYHWTLRDLDSVLLPTDGWSLALQGAVGYALSSPEANGPFSRAWGRATWYRPLGKSWYATARLEVGQVFARDSVGVPDTMLFRAGGDESVRGYAYRSLGPTVTSTVNGVTSTSVTSGRMVFTSSFEIARPISPKLPQFWWAAFVDAGNAADRWSEMDPALGYGVGLRWRSPVGPLRLDVAYGEQVHRARLHLSVGIAF